MAGGALRIEHPRFEVRRKLGEGGSGFVVAAYDRVRGTEVALKTFRRPGARSLLRLKQEFRALADVAHPRLLTLYDLFVEGEECFFSMELVDGVDLVSFVRGESGASSASSTQTFASGVIESRSRERPRPSATFDEARLRAVLAELIEGVRALHASGKVHRDLKPSNVLVRRDGRVVILDYGLVISLAPEERGFEGTAAYAAPEQATGDVGPAADWYAIGVILFEAITGVLPFEGSPLQILVDKRQREAPRIDELVTGAPPDLVELCARLLRREPGERGLSAASADAGAVIGRDREIARLEALLARCEHEGRVVVVEGPSGIGKTTLVRAFLDRARARGAVVLETRCNPREVIPYNAFDGAIDDLARVLAARGIVVEAPALRRIFPVLGEPGAVDDLDADAVRRHAFAALRAVLERLGPPLVFFLDDFHWADRDSQALLAAIVGVPALFILSQREIARTLPWSSETLAVPPLDAEASRALLSDVSALERDDLVRIAGGHPLFLRELARRPGASDLDEMLRARVAALSPELRRLVELVSIAVSPLPSHILSIAARSDSAQTERAIESLRVDRLLRVSDRGVEPFHDRVREAIAATLGDARELHADLVRALRDRDDPHALAHHLAGSGDREAAIDAALLAARRAEDALAFDRAAVSLRDALALGAADDSLRFRLADALVSAHRGVEAADVYLQINGEGRSRAHARAAELLLAGGEMERGRAILGAMLEEAGEALPRTQIDAFAALVVERARLALRGSTPTRRATIDPEAAARADLFRGVAQGLGMADNLRAAVFNARSLRAALELGDPARAGVALAVESIFRGSVDARRPRELLPLARALAEESGDNTALAWTTGAEAVLDALALENPDVLSPLARAEAFFQERTRGNQWALDSLKLVRALTLLLVGDLQTLRETLPEDIADARRRNDRYLETTMTRGSVMIWLCDGELAHAQRALGETLWTSWQDGFHIQHWLELEGYAEIDLYEGRGHATLDRHSAQFRALRRSLVGRLQRPRILARTTRGKLLLARAAHGTSRTSSLLECAWLASRLDAEGLGYARARAALLRAGIAALRGEHAALRSALGDAVTIADRYGLALTAAVARMRLGDDAGRAWMARARVREPERICDVEAPFTLR